MDPTVVTGVGATVALFGAAMTLIVRIILLSRDDIKRLEIREQRCERRLNLVVNAMREAGIAIPDGVWDD